MPVCMHVYIHMYVLFMSVCVWVFNYVHIMENGGGYLQVLLYSHVMTFAMLGVGDDVYVCRCFCFADI